MNEQVVLLAIREATASLMEILRLHAEAVMSAGRPTNDVSREPHEILGDVDSIIYQYEEKGE